MCFGIMNLMKRSDNFCRDSPKDGFFWTTVSSLIIFYLLIMANPAEPMAEPTVVCTRSVFNTSLITAFKELKNCTVLEGSLSLLQLQLPDPNNASYGRALESFTLPKLREITGYLFLYKSVGVQSLSDLFPNLTVIRGDNPLDENYSLLITLNEDLKRIGLNLAILNGSVDIRNNTQLCISESTATWKRYSPNSQVFARNEMSVTLNGQRYLQCTINNEPGSSSWPAPPQTTCHRLCLGGCTGPTAFDCYACRAFQHNETCIEECPHDKRISLYSRRCVDEAECLAHAPPSPIVADPAENETYPVFTVFNNTCVPKCPEPYTPFKEYGLLKCHRIGEHVCPGKAITTPAEAEGLRKCITVKSPIEMKFSRCKKYNFSEFEEALKKGLGDIEEISGGLHITRVHGLKNLHFLKNLRKITNAIVDSKNRTSYMPFSLTIDDNASLSELFRPNVTKQLRFPGNGVVAIINNPLLCPHKIWSLNKTLYDATHLVHNNNGRRAQCEDNAPPLHLSIENITDVSALVGWSTPEVLPVSYSTVYFRKAPGNITYTQLALNVPSLEYWESVDSIGNNSGNRLFLLTGLKPITRYAFYVEVIGQKNLLRVSKVEYFWTAQSKAIDRPCSVTAWPYSSLLSSDPSLKIEWTLPPNPVYNGPHEYLVTGEYVRDTVSPCSSPDMTQPFNVTAYDTLLKECKPGEISMSNRRQIINTCKEFSVTLDAVLKSTEIRAPLEMFPSNVNVAYESSFHTLGQINTTNRTDSTGRLEYFATVVQSKAVVVKNLIPYAEYIIKVYMCAIRGEAENLNINGPNANAWESRCSLPGFGVGRSSALENANKLILTPVALPFNYSSYFVLSWMGPSVTNSIPWYTIEITDENNSKRTLCSEKHEISFDNFSFGLYKICVTLESFLRRGGTQCIYYRVKRANHMWRDFFLTFFGIGFLILAIGYVLQRIQQSKSEDRAELLAEDQFDDNVRYSDLPGNDMENVPI